MANEYVTSAELKATLSLTGETFADADIALAVEAASRTIDSLCGTQFFPGPADELRRYTPTNARYLPIEDAAAISSVVASGRTLVLDSDYAQLGSPSVRMLAALREGVFEQKLNSVAVTGRFGFVAIPPEIRQATTLLAARLLKRAREAPFAVTGLELDGGGIRIARSDPDVQREIAAYVRHPAVV